MTPSYGALMAQFMAQVVAAKEAFAPKGAYGPTLWRTLPTSEAVYGARYGAYGANQELTP